MIPKMQHHGECPFQCVINVFRVDAVIEMSFNQGNKPTQCRTGQEIVIRSSKRRISPERADLWINDDHRLDGAKGIFSNQY